MFRISQMSPESWAEGLLMVEESAELSPLVSDHLESWDFRC